MQDFISKLENIYFEKSLMHIPDKIELKSAIDIPHYVIYYIGS